MPFDDGKKTVSGAIAHTDDAAAKVPFVSVKCGIAPTLTGKSAIECEQTRKNLLKITGTAVIGDLNVTPQADGTVVVNGQRSTALTWNAGQFTAKEACSIIFSGCSGGSGSTYSINIQKNNVYQTDVYNGDSTVYNLVQGDVIKFIVVVRANVSMSNVVFSPMIRFSVDTDGTFEKYTETQYTADLGRTIYGGSAEVVNGTGKEICGKIVFDGSESRWAEYATGNGYSIPLTGMKRGTWYTSPLALSYPLPKAPNNDNLGVRIGVNNDGIYVVQANTIEGVTDLTSFKAWLAENPLTIIYPLDTEIDFTFTPITPTPETVGKVNNVYCDTGNTELTYYDNAHGFSEVTVNKTGKNLFDISKVATTGTTAGISWSVSGNEITISGTATSSGWKTLVDFKLPHKGTYHFHMNATGNVGYFLRGWTQLVGKDVTEVCNDPSQTYRIAIAVATSGQSYSGTISEIQIEVGDSYTEYEPYEVVSKTAYLHKVIYGGQADVVRGTAKPKNLAELSNADNPNRSSYEYTTESPELIEWTKTGDGGKFYARFILHIPKPGKYTISCSADSTLKVKYIYSDELWGTTVFHNVSTNPFVAEFSESGDYVLGFYAGSSATSGTLKEVMCEEGETQTSYAPYFAPFSFPPISMETDEGENTLYASEGDSVITYRKETD